VKKDRCSKDTGRTINSMAEEEQSLVEEIFMKENGEMISFMEWGDT
jgi:hypothetical protein